MEMFGFLIWIWHRPYHPVYGHMHNRGPTMSEANSGPISKRALHPIARFSVTRTIDWEVLGAQSRGAAQTSANLPWYLD